VAGEDCMWVKPEERAKRKTSCVFFDEETGTGVLLTVVVKRS
jgi:hypothetical protein